MRSTLRIMCVRAMAASLVCLSAGVAAQDFRGMITGRISDSSGPHMPGVTVTATNVATNVASTATTTGEGNYTIQYLTPGRYTVAAELSGFKKFIRENIDVRVGDALTVDVVLEVGRLEETVSVTAESPLLELNTATTGLVATPRSIAASWVPAWAPSRLTGHARPARAGVTRAREAAR